MQGKGPHRAKGKYNTEDVDGWQKRSAALENSDPILPSPTEASSVLIQHHPASTRETDISTFRYPQKVERGSLPGQPDNQAEVESNIYFYCVFLVLCTCIFSNIGCLFVAEG